MSESGRVEDIMYQKRAKKILVGLDLIGDWALGPAHTNFWFVTKDSETRSDIQTRITFRKHVCILWTAERGVGNITSRSQIKRVRKGIIVDDTEFRVQ